MSTKARSALLEIAVLAAVVAAVAFVLPTSCDAPAFAEPVPPVVERLCFDGCVPVGFAKDQAGRVYGLARCAEGVLLLVPTDARES